MTFRKIPVVAPEQFGRTAKQDAQVAHHERVDGEILQPHGCARAVWLSLCGARARAVVGAPLRAPTEPSRMGRERVNLLPSIPVQPHLQKDQYW